MKLVTIGFCLLVQRVQHFLVPIFIFDSKTHLFLESECEKRKDRGWLDTNFNMYNKSDIWIQNCLNINYLDDFSQSTWLWCLFI